MLILTILIFILMVLGNSRMRKLLGCIYAVLLTFFLLFGYMGLFFILGSILMMVSIVIGSVVIARVMQVEEEE